MAVAVTINVLCPFNSKGSFPPPTLWLTMKLVQKRFLKGTREFEIVDDVVYARTRSLLKEEKSTVNLSAIDPEPVVTGSELEFHGLARSGPLLTLFLHNPNTDDFNAFIDTLRQRILEEQVGFSASESAAHLEGFAGNVHDAPPEFDEPDENHEGTGFQPVNPDRVGDDINMLKTYLNEADIAPLLVSLEALRAAPDSEAAFQQVVEAFNELGFNQGAVLTYAPYLKVLVSHTIWS